MWLDSKLNIENNLHANFVMIKNVERFREDFGVVMIFPFYLAFD